MAKIALIEQCGRGDPPAKSASTIVANLGSALLAGAFGRWFLPGPDHDRRGRQSAA